MSEDLLMPNEVAKLFRVHVKTVARWADQGHLPFIVTPGGHRRYKAEHVYRLYSDPPPLPPLR